QRNSLIAALLNRQVTGDTCLGPFEGTLRKAGVSYHRGIGCILLETRTGRLLIIKAWTTVKSPTQTANATLSRSLHSADTLFKHFSLGKAVANNMIKPSLGGHGENPLNWNVERLRNMGVWKI
ncbi:hypothetical protein MUO79_06940, partial [Candidatus Bathyarchaeota archaeon]|nr:hypothetical protein [Candidatus Bathyarchaeota archaeon]